MNEPDHAAEEQPQRTSAAAQATRCPACSTAFRVVADQLRVSRGWVRCGRCGKVFNAAEFLFELDGQAPYRVSSSAGPATAHEPAPGSGRPDPGPGALGRPGAPGDSNVPPTNLHAAPPAASAFGSDRHGEKRPEGADFDDADTVTPTQSPQLSPGDSDLLRDRFEDIDTRAEHDDPLIAPPDLVAEHAGSAAGGAAGTASVTADVAQGSPSFVRQADRAARWRRPGVRVTLALMAVLAGLGLGLQASHRWRDVIAARWPPLRPALEQGCRLLGCSVEAARAIDAMTVDSSGVVRIEKSNVYRLTAALRNRGAIEVAVPSLDLVMTDAQGQLLARKVFSAADLGSTSRTLAPGRELALQALVQTQFAGGEAVAGYTIELFYP